MPKIPEMPENFEGIGFEPLPAGDYNVKIVSSEEIRNKKSEAAGSDEFGMRMNFELEVLDGEYKGKKLFEGLNHYHPNKQTQDISQKTLQTMINACGKISPDKTEELHGIPMVASVVVTEGNANYGPSNKIKMYKEYDGIIQPTEEQKVKNLKSWG